MELLIQNSRFKIQTSTNDSYLDFDILEFWILFFEIFLPTRPNGSSGRAANSPQKGFSHTMKKFMDVTH
jgi:hypothetical protein